MSDLAQGARARPTSATDLDLMQAQVMAYARDLRTALRRSRDATRDLAQTHLETVAALASAVDVRDEITGGHVYRVANYGTILADAMAPELRDDPQLIYGFLLHDIGKLAVPDAVLGKQGPLDPDEQRVMRMHVEHGIRFVKGVSFLRPALNIIATHHENFDGTGYPQGIRGSQIPLAARMFTICDTFDAMIHDRPYRSGMAIDQAVAELRRCAGTQFDPDVVDGFESCLDEMLLVGERPPVPGQSAASRTERQTRDSDLASTRLFDSVDQAMVLVSPEGAIREANHRFLEVFHLVDAPVGMLLPDVVDRLGLPEAAGRELRDQLAQLSRDLFQGRRDGRATLDRRELTWFSNVIKGEGDAIVGRVIVFDVHETPPAYSDVLSEARTELDRAVPELNELADLLRTPDPDDPEWVARAQRVRDGVSRVQALAARLERQTTEMLDAGETFEHQHPEATPAEGGA